MTRAHETCGGEGAVVYRDVTYRYRGDEAQPAALERVSFDVRAGERLGILGPNGGGKSTLLKLTLGLLEPTAGEVRVFGMPPRDARARHVLGYVPQRIEAELEFPLSVRQVVEMPVAVGLRGWASPPGADRELTDRLLALVGIPELRDRPIGALSGGQVQRAMIARALSARPKVLLLDEPTVGIDLAGQKLFGELLKTLHAELALTTVIVSHDIRTVAAACDRVACLARTLHFHAAPEGLTPKVLADVFRHDMLAMYGDVHVDAHAGHECGGSCESHGELDAHA